jgi:hypothetical protein
MITLYALQTTFSSETLFIDWLEDVSISNMAHFREETKSNGKFFFTVDGHAIHVIPRLISGARIQKLSLIRSM